MSGYTKLFSDIVDSSIWKEDSDTCKVWITLLALSDWDGLVRGSVKWLADKSKVSIPSCQTALDKFQQPDPLSRTEDNEGRRIEKMADGWLILNYLIYRDRLSNNPIAIQTRERVRKHREKHLLRNVGNATSVTSTVPVDVSVSVFESVPKGEGTGRGKFQKPEFSELELYAGKIGLPPTEITKFENHYEANGWRVGKNPMKSWQASMRNWKINWEERNGANGHIRLPEQNQMQEKIPMKFI